MKYLIAGLGNIGEEYRNTRHNIGFTVLDAFAGASNAVFKEMRYGSVCTARYKGRELILLKPSTYMNLSGNAIRYWLSRENIPVENLLVIVDDLALPAGTIRMRKMGSDGGHNGLANINNVLATKEYARIRIGIGNNFRKGGQVSFVLGTWSEDEMSLMNERIGIVIEMIRSFAFRGAELTMSAFNKAGRMPADPAGEKDSPSSSGKNE